MIIDNCRDDKKRNRNFHDDLNDRFNKFLRNKNREKRRKKNIVSKTIKITIKKKIVEKMIVNDDEKNQENDTFVIDSNINFIEREKKI